MSKDVNAWAARVSRSCLRKKKYRSIKVAQEVAEKAFKERGVVLHCYYCNFCGCYHLTKTSDTREGKSSWRVF